MKTVFIFASILFIACACEEGTSVPEGKTQLRIKNASAYTMQEVIVNQTNYGSLSPGKSSSYREAEFVYRYAYIKMNVAGKDYILQPIDYVGETKYEEGKFTYELTLGELNGNLSGAISINFTED
jgi:hypothetical protein